jgi:hypothetical protein
MACALARLTILRRVLCRQGCRRCTDHHKLVVDVQLSHRIVSGHSPARDPHKIGDQSPPVTVDAHHPFAGRAERYGFDR